MTSESDSMSASHFLDVLRKRCPDYFDDLVIVGYRRGIDVYPAVRLPIVLGNALKVFQHAHGRLPDLVTLPKTADHFFKMKFFDRIPISPNPASKLSCYDYIPAKFAGRVRAPNRYWVSERPLLPPDTEIPPGIYWLKLEFGNAGHLRLVWPPTAKQRHVINQALDQRMKQAFGVSNGEWWYGTNPQRVFLEEDLSDLLEGGQELKLFIREGRFAAGYEVQYASNSKQKQSSLGFFNDMGEPMSGTRRLGRHNPDYNERQFQRPNDFDKIIEAAEVIGRPFSLVRVDMMRAKDGELFLGELTLCTGNATVIFTPQSLEDYLRHQLFETIPRPHTRFSGQTGRIALTEEKSH